MFESLKELTIGQRPAEDLLLADSKCDMIWGEVTGGIVHRIAWPDFSGCLCSGAPPTPAQQDQFTRHNGGSNIAFMDDRVKWYTAMNIKWARFGGFLRGHQGADNG